MFWSYIGVAAVKVRTPAQAAGFFIGVALDKANAGTVAWEDSSTKLWTQFMVSAAGLTVSVATANPPAIAVNTVSTVLAVPVCCGANKSVGQWWWDKVTR